MEAKISLNLVKNWQKITHDIEFSDVAAALIQNKVISVDEYQYVTSQCGGTVMEKFMVLLLKKEEDILLKFAEILKKDYSWLADTLLEGCVKEECCIKEEGHDEIDATPMKALNSDCEMENNTFFDNRSSNDTDTCDVCFNYNSLNKNELNNSMNLKRGDLKRKKIIKNRIKNKLKLGKPRVIHTDSVVSSTTDIIKPSSLKEEITDEVISILRRSPLISKSWTTLAHALGLTDRVHEIRYKVVIHGEDLSMCVVYLLKDWIEMVPETANLSKLIQVLRVEGFNNVSDKLTDILYGKQINV